MKPPAKRGRRSSERVANDIVRLCEYYGAPNTIDGMVDALIHAVTDGRVRIPAKPRSRKRGPRPIWRGPVGLLLMSEVQKLRRAAGGKLTDVDAIAILQDREPQTWGRHPDLLKRYYDARGYWEDVHKRVVEAVAAWVINF